MQSGEIWLVDLFDSKGHEQQGERPGVIVGISNGLMITVPLTSNLTTARFSHTYSISPSTLNGLKSESVAMIFQIVALDKSRFSFKMGSLDPSQMSAVRSLIKDLCELSD